MIDEVVRVTQEWLAERETEDRDIDDLRDSLRELPKAARKIVGDPDSVIAAKPRSETPWTVFISATARQGTARWPTGSVLVVTATDFALRTWLEVQMDPCNWVTRDAEVHGVMYEGAMPFDLDGAAWEGTSADEFNGSEWHIRADGGTYEFDLADCDLHYADSFECAPAGVYISRSEGGESLMSGEIGATVWVDQSGCAWARCWGCETKYFGRVGPDFDPADYVLDPAGSLEDLSSEMLDAQQMRKLLLRTINEVGEEFVADEVSIACRGFTGTAQQLLDATASNHDD